MCCQSDIVTLNVIHIQITRDALVELGDKIDDPQTASEAKSLIDQLEDISFIVTLILWNEILFEVNLISKSIQGKEVDISFCSENGYVDAVISTKEIAAELGIEPVFPEKRIRKRKRVFRMSLLRKCNRHLKKPLREKFFIH